MPRRSRAKVFIKPLEGMLDAEQEFRSARQLRQIMVNATRHMQAFPLKCRTAFSTTRSDTGNPQ